MTADAKIRLDAVSVVYGDEGSGSETVALNDISLSVRDGEFACLLGPSGCGKSTALNLIAGFLRPTRGEVLVDGEIVDQPGTERGVVFQDANIFPWLNVYKNVTFGPRMRGIPNEEYGVVAREALANVGLLGFEDHLPVELSGGMQQRVALARVLVNDPAVLLMDEPFGALDAQTRLVMQEWLLKLWEHARKTVLFITHDIDEAILLADRIYVMSARPGKIKRVLDVPLRRPRHYELTATPEFIRLKSSVLDLIKEESVRAIEQGV